MVKSNSLRTRAKTKGFQRGAKVTVPCAHCGKSVTRYASQFHGKLIFCSRGCWYTYRLGKPQKTRQGAAVREDDIAYRLADKEYAALYIKQDGMCAICLKHSKRLSIDHNHSTGQVRGLLCNNCNVALGMFGDSVPNMDRALNYLKHHLISND